MRRFSDPVEVRVRGESGSEIRGAGGRRMGRRPALQGVQACRALRQGSATREDGSSPVVPRPTLARRVTRRTRAATRASPRRSSGAAGSMSCEASSPPGGSGGLGGARRSTPTRPTCDRGRRLPLRRGSGRSGASRPVPAGPSRRGSTTSPTTTPVRTPAASPGPGRPAAPLTTPPARPVGLPPARPEGEGSPGKRLVPRPRHRLIALHLRPHREARARARVRSGLVTHLPPRSRP